MFYAQQQAFHELVQHRLAMADEYAKSLWLGTQGSFRFEGRATIRNAFATQVYCIGNACMQQAQVDG